MIIQQIIMMLVTPCTLAREVFKVSIVVKVQSRDARKIYDHFRNFISTLLSKVNIEI